MKKVSKALLWVFTVFLGLCTVVYLPSLASALFLASFAVILPIEKWQNGIKRFMPLKWIKPTIAAILVIAAVFAAPTNDINDKTTEATAVTTSTITNTTTSSADVVTTTTLNTTSATTMPTSTSTPATSTTTTTATATETTTTSKTIQTTTTSSKTIETTSTTSNVVTATAPVPADSSFEVHYIDVGQADAALVLCDGKAMLIDGGNAEDSNLIYAYLKKLSLAHLDYIVCTHAHEDHVGGLAGALNYATVDVAYCPVTSYDSKAFSNFAKYLDKQGVSITVPAAGDTFSLGSASITVLGPISETTETNNTSIVLRIIYGNTSFLFSGDAERDEEQDILDAGYTLESTVLKVGHHGSANSTIYPFLREVMPLYAVISVGAGNSYGHPTEEALSRLRDADVKVYRTDIQGDIICKSDGQTVSFTVRKNDGVDTLAAVGPNSTQTTKATTATATTAATTRATTASTTSTATTTQGTEYILNTNTRKFHYPYCYSVDKIKDENKQSYTGSRDDLIAQGYSPCGNCNP